MAGIDFWYEFASTYSYPAAMRIEGLAAAAGVSVRWRPFLLGPMFKARGWNDSPFNIYADKGRYMWRDLARICEADGLLLKLPPARFPQNGLKAARVALTGAADGWTPAFTRAAFLANYAEQKDIADDATLEAALVNIGVDPVVVLVAANEAGNKAALRTQTGEAMARGIFGAPSFTVGEELFWGKAPRMSNDAAYKLKTLTISACRSSFRSTNRNLQRIRIECLVTVIVDYGCR